MVKSGKLMANARAARWATLRTRIGHGQPFVLERCSLRVSVMGKAAHDSVNDALNWNRFHGGETAGETAGETRGAIAVPASAMFAPHASSARPTAVIRRNH